MSLHFFPRNSIVHLQCFYSFYSLSTVSATCQSFILLSCNNLVIFILIKTFMPKLLVSNFLNFFKVLY